MIVFKYASKMVNALSCNLLNALFLIFTPLWGARTAIVVCTSTQSPQLQKKNFFNVLGENLKTEE